MEPKLEDVTGARLENVGSLPYRSVRFLIELAGPNLYPRINWLRAPIYYSRRKRSRVLATSGIHNLWSTIAVAGGPVAQNKS
jgi:hypothetical protein